MLIPITKPLSFIYFKVVIFFLLPLIILYVYPSPMHNICGGILVVNICGTRRPQWTINSIIHFQRGFRKIVIKTTKMVAPTTNTQLTAHKVKQCRRLCTQYWYRLMISFQYAYTGCQLEIDFIWLMIQDLFWWSSRNFNIYKQIHIIYGYVYKVK